MIQASKDSVMIQRCQFETVAYVASMMTGDMPFTSVLVG